MKLNVWAPAPNRHITPLLDELHRRGALAGAFYLSSTMNVAKQVGGAARTSYPYSLVRDLPRDIDTGLRQHPGAHNLVISFETDLCKLAMLECLRRGLPYSLFAESLQPRERHSPARFVRDSMYRILVSRVQTVFAMGPLAATQMVGLGIDRKKIHPAAYPMPSSPAPVLPKSPGRIVFCGRLVELKRVCDLIRAIARSPEPVRSAEFVIVGDGPERRTLEDLARAEGVHVEFIGSVDAETARAWIGTGTLLVLPTRRREGWGYVVNEAIEAGLGVVVSDKVGAGELVVEGLSGHTFCAMDAEDLSKKLCSALEDDRAEARARFYGDLRSSLSSEAICDYLLATLSGAPRPAPWLTVIERFGGNVASAFWSDHATPVARSLTFT